MQVLPTDHTFLSRHCNILVNSLRQLTGKNLISTGTQDIVKSLYEAPFVIVSHNTLSGPVFNFANLKAQNLWETNWDDFTQMESRLSAETDLQEKRQLVLDEVNKKGFIENYEGIRISKTGKRFLIKNTTIWNLYDEDQKYYGQAATFSEWEWL